MNLLLHFNVCQVKQYYSQAGLSCGTQLIKQIGPLINIRSLCFKVAVENAFRFFMSPVADYCKKVEREN